MLFALCEVLYADTETGHGHVFNVKGLKGEGVNSLRAVARTSLLKSLGL
jgi:hypothetical protein